MKTVLKKAFFLFALIMIAGELIGNIPVLAAAKTKVSKPKISIKVTDDKIKVTLKATQNAESYEIYLLEPGSEDYIKAAVVKKDGTVKRSYTFTDLSEGEYKVKVRAYNGETCSKYSSVKKAVIKSEYDFTDAKKGDIIQFGRYEQDNKKKNGKERLEWVVLEKNDSGLLLLSKDIIDCVPFHDVSEDAVWESSSIRKWLNKTFYGSAFNTTESNMIKKLTIDNGKGMKTLSTEKIGGVSTKDKVFLLSLADAQSEDYGFSGGAVYYDEKLRAAGTKYSIARGLAVFSHENEGDNYGTTDGEPSGAWWLRDPGLTGKRGTTIDAQGDWSTTTPYTGTDVGVRPAIFIKFKSE